MKKIICSSFFLIVLTAFTQQNLESPRVAWKLNDIPPTNPDNSIMFPNSNAPDFQPRNTLRI